MRIEQWNALIQRRRQYIKSIHYTFDYIKDQETLQTITLFAAWKLSLITGTKSELEDFQYKYFDEYWNFVINSGKKMLESKCKYMPNLIAMYEYYYWCQYVLKYVSNSIKKMEKEGRKELRYTFFVFHFDI